MRKLKESTQELYEKSSLRQIKSTQCLLYCYCWCLLLCRLLLLSAAAIACAFVPAVIFKNRTQKSKTNTWRICPEVDEIRGSFSGPVIPPNSCTFLLFWKLSSPVSSSLSVSILRRGLFSSFLREAAAALFFHESGAWVARGALHIRFLPPSVPDSARLYKLNYRSNGYVVKRVIASTRNCRKLPQATQ